MPNSYIGLLGVDKSVLLLKSGNDIDRDLVTNELTQFTIPNVFNSDWEDEFDNSKFYRDFSSSSAVVLTNAKDEFMRPIEFRPGPVNFVGSGQGGVIVTTSQPPAPTQIKPEEIPSPNEIVTRRFFPETWLFDCIEK
jgi:hypothetical protein